MNRERPDSAQEQALQRLRNATLVFTRANHVPHLKVRRLSTPSHARRPKHGVSADTKRLSDRTTPLARLSNIGRS